MRRVGCLLAREGAISPGAQRTLLEVALAHSPRVEDAAPGLVYLDLTGLHGLFGDEPLIGDRLRRHAAGRGLAVSVGIGGSRATARLAARWGDGVRVVAPGEDAAALAPAPLGLLDCAPETAALLARWGLGTLGDLAALPAVALFERLGAEGLRLHEQAQGRDPRPLSSWGPPRLIEETMALDWEVVELEPLRAIVRTLAERAAARLAREALEADRIEWSLRLADGAVHEGALSLAVPGREPAALATLVMGAVEARRPPGPVTGVLLRVHPVRLPAGQGSLLDPARPGARALAETLAGLAALVGAAQVGVPVLLDSHRPDAMRVDASPLLAPGKREGAPTERRAALALRRLRPPGRAAVRLTGGRPVHLHADRLGGPIVSSVGPWRASGEWWLATRWALDEWDVELADGTLCRLAHDGAAWSLAGIYD